MRTIEQRLAALEANRPATAPPLITSNFVASEWQTLLISAPSTGEIRINLPKATPQNRGAVVWLAFLTTGAARLVASGGTVNGVAAGITNTTVGAFSAVSDGSTGWLVLPGIAAGSIPISKLADLAAYSVLGRSATTPGAMSAISAGTAGHHLVRNGSTDLRFIDPAGAGLSLATTGVLSVNRGADFATTPWTGNHSFDGQVLLGGEQDVSGTGAINVTLGDVVRLRFSHTSGNHTVGTVSGCADGRLLVVEFNGSGTHTITHDGSAENAFGCPGDTNLVINGRGGFIAVGRLGTNANWKILATTN